MTARSRLSRLVRDGRDAPRSAARLLALLVLASAALMVVDARGGTSGDSPIDPARAAVGTVVGPVEAGANSAVRPFRALGDAVRTNGHLRGRVATLQEQNSDLRSRLATEPVDRNRLAEYDGLTSAAHDTGYTLVPAHVVGIGAAQSFTRTVTLDAGTSAGIHADSTVVSKDGLVGRVVRATRDSATVLLAVDSQSVVGGRLASTMKIGFLRGNGSLGNGGRLSLDLVDNAVPPQVGDAVVTWGSGKGGPYVAGIPIGQVTKVSTSPRELSRTATIKPYVDFGALDLVGVVVAKGTHSDRSLIQADGKVQ
ncbi:rod shape-determining protein MreC [Nocardioides mangrovicus]|uniref:Cell shape-determining protein MreC n=1 Tax=Nocardioides mangrovicus TaxID=2478913 RepID=A0A3L8P307_9ACTN|nr:rod shape-determining protein MreC [Nocardioides mangrovicus]RLV49695.1 rod shape-determining protein MreC [Nocardioides mangrovicus]